MATETILRAFSADHVVKLTGLSERQLRYWDKTDFFSPEYAHENRRSPFSRVYSFRDLVGLRTLSLLRKEHNVPLRRLRTAAEKLSDLSDSVWAELVIYVFNRDVYFKEPETGKIRGANSSQYVVDLPLKSVIEDMEGRVEQLRARPKKSCGQITRNRNVRRNSWVVEGTRVPTAAIRQFSEAGYTAKQIIREYPMLTTADIKAALLHEQEIVNAA